MFLFSTLLSVRIEARALMCLKEIITNTWGEFILYAERPRRGRIPDDDDDGDWDGGWVAGWLAGRLI